MCICLPVENMLVALLVPMNSYINIITTVNLDGVINAGSRQSANKAVLVSAVDFINLIQVVLLV